MRKDWYQDWEPSRRPIQLQLPILTYESNLAVWQEKMRTILRHASISGCIDTKMPANMFDTNNERWAAATYCLALLESSLSEEILVDRLTLSSDAKLPQDPYVLFTQVELLVKAVQMLKRRSNPAAHNNLWNVLQGRRHYQHVHGLLDDLEMAPKNEYTGKDFCKFVLVAALLVKRYFPTCQPRTIQQIINEALTEGSAYTMQPGEQHWVNMRNLLRNVV